MNGGEIPLRYFDRGSYQRTFGIKAYGLSMKDIFMSLCSLLETEEILDICKVDSNTFNFTVKDDQAAEILTSVGRITIKGKTYPVISISKQTVEFRVHWLPSYIKDTFVEDFFSHYGKVTSVTRDAVVFTPDDTKRTGVRRVMIETDELRKRTIPYVVSFAGGYSALITMAGRPPLCLRCRQIGHLRKDCVPSNANEKPTSYANAADRRKPSQSTDDAVTGEEEVQAKGEQTEVEQTGGDLHESSHSGGATGGEADTEMEGSVESTGSTIPPNQQKRDHSDSFDDDLDINDGMTLGDIDSQFVTVGPGGKKVKV